MRNKFWFLLIPPVIVLFVVAISFLRAMFSVPFHGNTMDAPIFRLVESSAKMSLQKIETRIRSERMNVNVTSASHVTPLHISVYCNPKIIPLLIKNGANVNAQDDDGNTPLHYAIYNGKVQAVELLMKHGASKEIKNKEQETAVTIAIHNNLEKSPGSQKILSLVTQ